MRVKFNMNNKELGFPLSLPTTGENQRLNSMAGMGYSIPVAAQSAAGFGDPINSRRTGALPCIAGAFFTSVVMLYGSCARETFGSAGFLESRFANPRTAATLNCLATICGSSSTQGVPLMQKIAQNPSVKNRVAALKARAISALHANSSLKVRLTRYNTAMQKARALEIQGGAQ